MVLHDVKQGSDEWFDLRRGIPTASQFHRILNQTTMKLKTTSFSYMCELIAEPYVGPLDQASSQFMQRGSEMEKTALRYYEFQREVDTQQVGFVTNDEGTVGGSPDALVGDDGGLEIKCRSAGIHVQSLLRTPTEVMPQVQGLMWLTERKWWDFLSYNPIMPSAFVRIERDEVFISALAAAVALFDRRLREKRREVKAMLPDLSWNVAVA